MKVIVSFSIASDVVSRLRNDCNRQRVSFSQYAEYALEVAPPMTEELAVKLARRRRGLPETNIAADRSPEAAD